MRQIEEKLVSVIIPNRGSIEPRTITSLKAQTYQNIEIITVNIGKERSAQVNRGAKMSKGQFYYRVDDDFVLEPNVIEEAVKKCEEEGCDAILIENVSDPTISLWAKVIKMERDCYRDDPETNFARFVRRDAFWAVGGYDEKFNAIEDRDFSERLLKANFKFGRIAPKEIHIGEPKHLSEVVRKFVFYGSSFREYLSQHGTESVFKLGPLRRAYVRHWRELMADPTLYFPFILYQMVRYASAMLGILTDPPILYVPQPCLRKLSYGSVIVARKKEDVKFDIPNSVIMDGHGSLNEKRNLGASQFTTDLIAFIDDDNKLAPDTLEEMAKAFRLDEKIGAVSPLIFDAAGEVWFAGVRWTDSGIVAINKTIPKGYRATESFHDVFMVRHSAFREAGGFDSKRFPFYLAEADLAERMKNLGYYFVVAPKAKVWHDTPSTLTLKTLTRRSHIENTQRAYLVGRNRLLFLRMHKPLLVYLTHIMFILPFLATFHIIGMLNQRKFGMVKSYLHGLKDGLKGVSS